MNKITLVIARYKEDISWADNLGVTVRWVQKEFHLPNVGREPSSYLYFIVRNYEKLDGLYVFSQGRMSDQCPDLPHNINVLKNLEVQPEFLWFGKENYCDKNGNPDHPNLPVGDEYKNLTQTELDSEKISFKEGSFFAVHADVIRRRPKSFYEELLKRTMEEANLPWVLERLWSVVFDYDKN